MITKLKFGIRKYLTPILGMYMLTFFILLGVKVFGGGFSKEYKLNYFVVTTFFGLSFYFCNVVKSEKLYLINFFSYFSLSLIGIPLFGIDVWIAQWQNCYEVMNLFKPHTYISIVLLQCTIFYLEEFIKEDKKKINLVWKREKDLDRIKNYLEIHDVLGIEGRWRSGKSYLVEKLIQELEEKKKSVVMINLMNASSNDVFKIVLNQLDKILLRKGNVSTIFSRAKNIFEFGSYKGFKLSNFFRVQTEKEQLEEFKEVMIKSEQKIYVIFDDVDRIDDEEKILKALGFGAEFGMESLKIIYLYHQESIEEISDKFHKRYLQKYIPTSIHLTKVSFKEMLEEKKKEHSWAEEYDLEFLCALFSRNPEIYFDVSSREGQKKLTLWEDFNRILGRKGSAREDTEFGQVELFLHEIKSLNLDIERNQIDIEKRIVYAYAFVKVFLLERYSEFLKFKSLEKTFPVIFEKGETAYTLEELAIINLIILKNYEEVEYERRSLLVKVGERRFELKRLNELLNPLNIEVVKGKKVLVDSKVNYSSYNLLSKKLQEFKMSNESNDNFFIRCLLNEKFQVLNNVIEVQERRGSINNAINKLNFAGTVKYLSAEKTYYKYLKEVLKIEDIKERKEKYNTLFTQYQQKIDYQPIHFFGEQSTFKDLGVISIFGNKEEEENFIEINKEDKITDYYLLLLAKSTFILKPYKINWYVIEEFIKKEFNVKSEKNFYEFLEVMRLNIGKLTNGTYQPEALIKREIRRPYEIFSCEIDELFNSGVADLSNEITKDIKILKEFIDKVLKIFETYNFLNRKERLVEISERVATTNKKTKEKSEFDNLNVGDKKKKLGEKYDRKDFNILEISNLYKSMK